MTAKSFAKFSLFSYTAFLREYKLINIRQDERGNICNKILTFKPNFL